MTKLYIVAIYDKKLEAYMNPYTVPALGLAERHFGDEANNPESPISKHPEDYTLYKLGTFDTDTAQFDTHTPVTLAEAAYFHKPEK